MSQQDLERKLARATGEDLRTIRRGGFQLMTPLSVYDPDDDVESRVYGWDQKEARPLRLVT